MLNSLDQAMLRSVGFFLVASAVSVGVSPSASNHLSDTWERAIVAKGGRERLHDVKSVVISARSGSGRSFETIFALPSKMWSWNDERPTVFGRWVEMINVERGTKQIAVGNDLLPLGEPTPAVMEWMRILQLLLFLETHWQQPTLSEDRPATRFRAPVIVATLGRDSYEIEFDKATALPRKMTHTRSPSLQQWVLRDYRSVQGLMLPHEVRGPAAALAKSATWKMSFELNVDYDPRVFERPPSVSEGPKAWKR